MSGSAAFLACGALGALGLILAALHDISRAGQNGYVLEYAFLATGAVGWALFHWRAMRILEPKARRLWLWATMAVLALLDSAALAARLRPRYPNDAAVGTAVLAATLPLLGLVCYQLICPCCRKQSNCRFE